MEHATIPVKRHMSAAGRRAIAAAARKMWRERKRKAKKAA